MMPDARFVGLDDGGRKILDPRTGEHIQRIPGVETFEDVRSVLRQVDLFPAGSSCVIDTATLLEQVIERHVLDTVSCKTGVATNIKSYGFNDGQSHLLDALRTILQDLDGLIRRGVNVGLVCQEQAVRLVNTEGLDYLKACPKLHHDSQYSLMLEVCAWADHLFRIDYLSTIVRGKDDQATTGKIIGTDDTRVIYIGGARHYEAKTRTRERFVNENGEFIGTVSFEAPDDSSLWDILFGQEDSQ